MIKWNTRIAFPFTHLQLKDRCVDRLGTVTPEHGNNLVQHTLSQCGLLRIVVACTFGRLQLHLLRINGAQRLLEQFRIVLLGGYLEFESN